MPVNIDGDIFYRTAEVCQQTDISRATLIRWLNRDIIEEPLRDRRGWRLFTGDDLNKIRAEANRIRRR